MNTTTQTTSWGDRLRAVIVAFAVLVAGALVASSPRTAFAAPAAGTVIGNQATATYTDGGGTPRIATSNQVTTVVSQVKSFTLATDGAQTASSGQTVYYQHTLTNTGNGTDTYALIAANTAGFNHGALAIYADANNDGLPDGAAITSTGAIAAGGIFRFVVAGVVPGSAASGATGTITVTATDTNTPVANTATRTDVTTVANSAISVTKLLSVASGPSPSTAPITVTLSYANTGSAAATTVVITDILPAGMSYIANSGRWSVTGGGVILTDTNADGPQSGITYDFTAGVVTASIGNVPAGFSGNVTFQVNIAAGLPPGFINNTAQYVTATQTTSTSTNIASYQVLRVAGVVANGSTTVSTNNVGEPVLIAPSAPAGSTISFTNVIWNMGNAADSFVISMAGQGSWPAGSTFTLLQSDGATNLVASTTPSIPVYSAGCAAGFETDATNSRCGYRVILRVQLPVSATGGPYSITKTATSTFDSTKTDTVVDTLQAVAVNTVDLTNNSAGPGAPGAGATGTTVITTNDVTPSTTGPTITRFRLYVNNTSSITDSYNLTSALTPAGWTTVFRADGGAGDCSTVGAILNSTGPINAATARLICAEVTVPATTTTQAAVGTYPIDFTATSALNGTVFDVKRDAVNVLAARNVTLTPNNVQQTFPSGVVTYTHVITNTGNVAEDISFAAGFLGNTRAAQGWTAVAYVDGNGNGIFEPGIDDVPANLVSTTTTIPGLAVNASRSIFVRVFAPPASSDPPGSPANVTTLTATYTPSLGGASLTTSATDTTSVTEGLVLVKEQRTINCDGTPTTPAGVFSTGPIASGPLTAPGQCISYRITGTNTTALTITAVVISDVIPANTKHRVSANACSGAATTVGTITGAPADGAAGTIVATVGPLSPSQSAAVTFCVRIDP